MVLWIESQTAAAIVAIVFGMSYLAAAVVFLAAALMPGRNTLAHMKATQPVMLTPLSVIAGLLIAFLANRVWSNLDQANAYVWKEASALQEAILVANSLPAEVSAKVRSSVKTYLAFIKTTDWPAMAEGRANLRMRPPGLPEALAALLAFTPQGLGQALARQRAVGEIEDVLAVRRSRILLSESVIAPLQWTVIVILALLLLVTVAMVHSDRLPTTAVNLFIFATAVAASLVLLMVYDRPFAAGGNTVQPSALLEIRMRG